MKVLTDRHHGVLIEALSMLFTDRLGAEVAVWQDGHYVTSSVTVDFPPRTYTVLDTAAVHEWQPDLVVATVGGTRQPLRSLASAVGARYIDQVGNAWDEPISADVLWSVAHDDGLTYHPEFHRVPWTEPTGNLVGSFHASFAHSPCREAWDRAAAAYPDHEFVMFGTTERPLYPFEVAQQMQRCVAIWHCKDADGYGFTVHEAFASGRPVIGHAHHYAGKLAGPLFRDGHVEPEHIDRALADPVRYGRDARASFAAIVDFDAEAASIAAYIA